MCFAAIYFFCDPDYVIAVDGKFDAWNLAVQTFLTIGYGVLTPDDSWWAVLWGVCATLLAVFDVAIITGVPYIKFSKPRCKILFSTVVTVHMHEGVPTLTIRIANLHKTPIFNLSCTMYSVSMGKTTEGISHIKPVQLHLQTENILVFQDNFILQHRLDASSPLYQVWKQAGAETAEILETGEEGTEPLNLSIHVTVQGNDALLQDTVHARHIYHINDFRFDCHFDDMVIPESEHYGWEKDGEKLMKTRWSRSASVSSVLDGQNGNQSEWETNHKGIGMPPRMVLACGRMDDTKVSVKHVNDLVIRKVADAMALHHLGEETYHGMLKADKKRVRDSKLRSGNSRDLSSLRASGGGSGGGGSGGSGSGHGGKSKETQENAEDAGVMHVMEVPHQHGKSGKRSSVSSSLPGSMTNSGHKRTSVFQFMSHHDPKHSECLDVLGRSVLSLLSFFTHTIHSTTDAHSLLVLFFFFFFFFFFCLFSLSFVIVSHHRSSFTFHFFFSRSSS